MMGVLCKVERMPSDLGEWVAEFERVPCVGEFVVADDGQVFEVKIVYHPMGLGEIPTLRVK